MRRLFRSKKFKIILSVAVTLAVFAVVFGTLTGWPSPQTVVTSAIVQPIQSAYSTAANAVSGFFENFAEKSELREKNKELRREINEYRKELVEYEDILRENEFYKKYLEIKESNPDYTMQPAMVIARDNTDPYRSFTVNSGLGDGVSLYDPVITDAGLVGYITEVTATQSVVTTILSPEINVTAVDNRTRDSGNITGDDSVIADKCTTLTYLPKGNAVAAGDYIITSGAGGIFPAGHIIGTVKAVRQNTGDLTAYAIIEPVVDAENVTEVMIITEFEGQGALSNNDEN